MKKPTIVLTGCNGQLGQTFQYCWKNSVLAQDYQLITFDRTTLDIADNVAVNSSFDQIDEIAAIVNAAAYTAVDKAESEEQHAYAHNANTIGPTNLGKWAAENGARLIHLSTDFVFDGKARLPYLTDDQTAPLSVYGQSKLEGEKALGAIENLEYAIVRTSWVYSPYSANFLLTMLRLMSEREELNVVADQRGCPTSTFSLAQLLLTMLSHKHWDSKLYHWSDLGEISWFDFAIAIHQQARDIGLLDKEVRINPITTAEYPTAAKRPEYSLLDCSKTQRHFGIEQQPWQQQLHKILNRMSK